MQLMDRGWRMKAKASEASRIESRVKQNKCIVVETDDQGNAVTCDEKMHQLGVCHKHYNQVRKGLIARRSKSQKTGTLNRRQRAYLDKARERGLILRKHEVWAIKRSNVYEDL